LARHLARRTVTLESQIPPAGASCQWLLSAAVHPDLPDLRGRNDPGAPGGHRSRPDHAEAGSTRSCSPARWAGGAAGTEPTL